MRNIFAAAVSVALVCAVASPALAAGKKNGFDTITVGGSTKYNPNASSSNTTTVTTSGPKGQLQNSKDANVSFGKTDRPGQNMP